MGEDRLSRVQVSVYVAVMKIDGVMYAIVSLMLCWYVVLPMVLVHLI